MDYVAFIEKCGEVAQWVCPIIEGCVVGFIVWACVETVRDCVRENKRYKIANKRHQKWMEAYRARNAWRYEDGR